MSALLVCWLALPTWTGCGASRSEVREATRSGYDADFAIVYREVLAAVRQLYPHLSENPATGVIRTAWHPVRVSSGQEARSTQQSEHSLSTTSVTRKQYYIRFDVLVVGGDPWRVRVKGRAAEWDVAGVPAELRGGNEPHWLKGRTDGLRVAIHRRLASHAVALPSTALEVEAPVLAEPVPALDVRALGDIPPEAAQAAAAVAAAAHARDLRALRALLHPEVVWSLGAPPGVESALAIWQADASLLGLLAGVIEDGCRVAPAAALQGAQVTCPPAFGAEPGYRGYRAGFAPGKDGAWRLVFFVGLGGDD